MIFLFMCDHCQFLNSFIKLLFDEDIKVLLMKPAVKDFFVQSKGMEKLLEFMSCEHEEKVLRSSATTLLTLISTESAKYGIEFVRLGGVQVSSLPPLPYWLKISV